MGLDEGSCRGLKAEAACEAVLPGYAQGTVGGRGSSLSAGRCRVESQDVSWARSTTAWAIMTRTGNTQNSKTQKGEGASL